MAGHFLMTSLNRQNDQMMKLRNKRLFHKKQTIKELRFKIPFISYLTIKSDEILKR